MKDLLRHHKKPNNTQEMVELIQAVWDEVPFEQLQDLIAHMPNRIQAVISAMGGSTRW